MPIDSEISDPFLPITAEEATAAAHDGGLFADDPAARLVVQDCLRAEGAEMTKAFILGWTTASLLYQSPYAPNYWEGTNVPAASVPFFTVATAVNSLTPQIINGLFYDNPPFMIQERPGTTSQAARAIGALLAYQLEDINFREELRLGTTNAALYGSEIFKWGWENYTRERKIYKRATPTVVQKSSIPGAPSIQIDDDEIEETIETETIDRPSFEHIVNLKHVLVDPGLNVPDIRKAKYVIHRMYMTWKELERLRDRPGFDIPSEKKLLEMLLPPVKEEAEAGPAENSDGGSLWDARAEPRFNETSANPLEDPLEVLERWDNETYTVVLQKKIVLCNDKNPYGKIPFLSINWWDVPEAFWGLGLGRTIGSEQRLQQGITNIWLDQATLNLNGVYVRIRGKNVPTQNIRIAPGKIIDVEDKDGFKPLERQPAVPEAQQHIILSQARAEQVSGANEAASQGIAGNSGHSNLARSSAGAQLIASGAANRLSDFVEKLSNQIIIPFLYEVYEMDRAMLPISQMRYILNDELENEFIKSGGDIIDLLNARVKFSILAGAKMQARRNMAQALPLMTQFLMNPSTESHLGIQKKTVDVTEITRMQFEASDWKNENDVVRDMTPEEEQRWQAAQPAAAVQAKAAVGQQQQETKFEQAQQLADQQNEAKAARDILREQYKSQVSGAVSNVGGLV